MKLISAEKIEKDILYCKKVNNSEGVPTSEEFNAGMNQTFDLIFKILKKQSIAYDVEKVVEQLSQFSEIATCPTMTSISQCREFNCEECKMRSAIEIVKAGGRNE